jgi:hypothetical protein
MDGKLFSLDEANRLLPLVRSITRDAVRRYRDAKRAILDLEGLKARAAAKLPVRREEIEAQDAAVAAHLEQLRRLVDELEALGCRLRDYERGVVDFPAATIGDDGFLVYCWALGEESVRHWHSEEEGFDERRLLETRA